MTTLEIMSRDELRSWVLEVAMSLPPVDFGSTKAIVAMSDALFDALRGEYSPLPKVNCK